MKISEFPAGSTIVKRLCPVRILVKVLDLADDDQAGAVRGRRFEAFHPEEMQLNVPPYHDRIRVRRPCL
jgi:hypothetical protein